MNINNKTKLNIFEELKNDFNSAKEAFKGKPYKHLPNIISALRVLSVPLIGSVALTGNMLSFFALSSLSFLSDKLDGTLAKGLDAKSDLGVKLDPIADKLLSGIIMLMMLPTKPFITVLGVGEAIISNTKCKIRKLNSKTEPSNTGRYKSAILDVSILATILTAVDPSMIPTIPYITNIIKTVIEHINPILITLYATTIIMQIKTYNGYNKELNTLIEIDKEKNEEKNKKVNHIASIGINKGMHHIKHPHLISNLEKAIYGETDITPTFKKPEPPKIFINKKKHTCRNLIQEFEEKPRSNNIKVIMRKNQTK